MKKAILRFDISDNDIGKLAQIHIPSLPDNLFIPAIIEAEPKNVAEHLRDKIKGDLISREVLKDIWELYKQYQPRLATNVYEFGVALKDTIDNAPTVEPQKVLVANVTFDKDQLEQLVQDRVIEPIKNGELVLQTDERPHGEWIFDGVYHDSNNPIGSDMYHCSICKRSIITTLTKPTVLYPFCHCGADMRKGGAK